MAGTIRDALAGLDMVRRNLEGRTAAVEADWRLSEEAKRVERDAAHASLKESLTGAARTIFGDAGVFWKRRDELKAQLHAARDLADTLDPPRLANTYRRVSPVVVNTDTLQELETWYREKANTYERRAFQDIGEEEIRRRFPGVSEVGSFLRTLKQDREKSLTTPEMENLATSITLLEQEAYAAHGKLKSEMRALGMNGLEDGPRILDGIIAHMYFEDVSRGDAKASYTIEKWENAGGYIPIKEGELR